jgi:hypothetical protein
MKLMKLICTTAVLAFRSVVALAQTDKPAERHSAVQVLDICVTNAETHLVPLADKNMVEPNAGAS